MNLTASSGDQAEVNDSSSCLPEEMMIWGVKVSVYQNTASFVAPEESIALVLSELINRTGRELSLVMPVVRPRHAVLTVVVVFRPSLVCNGAWVQD